jgi:hypothetical protein
MAGPGRCGPAPPPTPRPSYGRHTRFQRIGAADTPAIFTELNALTSPGPAK